MKAFNRLSSRRIFPSNGEDIINHTTFHVASFIKYRTEERMTFTITVATLGLHCFGLSSFSSVNFELLVSHTAERVPQISSEIKYP
jgi:hypothetical protein